MINDTAPWLGWFGVVFAAGLCAWLGLARRELPLWLGVVSAIALAIPTLVMAASGAVAIAGPVWLGVASVGLALRRARESPP